MTEPMAAYTGDSVHCPKCQHHGATTTWRPAGAPRTGTWEAVAYRFDADIDSPERLERECPRCGHTWDEALANDNQEESA